MKQNANILANGSMSSNQSGEGDIRRALIEADLVDTALRDSAFPQSEATPQVLSKAKNNMVARQHLATWDKPALLALVKDLYDASAGNRNFIQARCQAEDSGGEVLEIYRSKIVEQFFSKRAAHGMGPLKLGEARKAIRDYRKATGNIPGTAELLMTYAENGARFTHEYGDIDERFYSSVESALDELAALLRGEARELYPKFRERLAKVEQMTDGIGWGFHDFVAGVVSQLEDELAQA